MTSKPIALRAEQTRCLAKTADGKPNGCFKADRCARHVAIHTDAFDGSTHCVARMCGDELGVHAFFIHVDALPA